MSEVESRTQGEMVGWLDSKWWPDMNEIHGAHERPPLDALIMRHSALALERFGMEALLIHEIWTWESHLWRGFESWVGGVTASQGVGPYSEDLAKRLKKDWIRYTRARLDEDQATTAARLARAKSTFTATFPGESKLDMGVVRRLKEAWDELEKSVEHEWQILFDSCEAEEPFRTSRPGLPFQRSPPGASITTPPSGNRLVDYLDRYDKNAEEEFSGSTSQLIPLYNFWKKERERRFECEAKDVEGWFERGIAACDAALGSPGSSVMPYIVVHPTKWILITQDMVESEGIGPLSRSLQRNPYIQLIEFSGFRNDEELAYAIREIIPRTASSLTTIAMPVYTLQIGNHTISALAALVKENTGIRSILANLPSLDLLAAGLANRESVAGHATTSYTFQGFRVVSGGSIPPRYLSNEHSRVSESKIELRFPGPHHGVLKLVLHHHSGSETTLALRINDKTLLPVLVARSQNTQEYMLSPHEDYNPGAQNIIVVTPSSNAYKLYSIDLIDEDGMPFGNEASREDGRESQSGN
ncbi:hypothetical protein FPV67DRAFT_267331 [Lyophyllum atratum]|nr:hypothetical protein FPV67DRAFT_267331 [Lyophyllum atratum]